MEKSFTNLYHQGEETLLVPEEASRTRMGDTGFRLTSKLLEQARLTVARSLNISLAKLYYSGSLLKRMDYPPLQDSMQVDVEHDSHKAHIDKANIASYDWSCLLYMNSVDEEFGF